MQTRRQSGAAFQGGGKMGVQLRPYQTRMVQEVGRRNVIVKMPTGSGKTLVAAECMRLALQRGSSDGDCRHAVFLVPTRDLVEQQARAVRGWCAELRVKEFMSNLAVPDSFDVLVATPDAFRRLQMRQETGFGWTRFCICVFDEVHHVLKDHPYRKLAQSLRRSSSKVQVVGLSASLTYAVGETDVRRALQRMSDDLGLESMACPSDAELRAGGYEPPHGEVELVAVGVQPEGVVPVDERKPHLMHKTFFDRVERGEATEFALNLVAVVRALEQVAREYDVTFESPLKKPSLSAWETYANQLTRRKNLAAQRPFFELLENWYVAMRILITTWEEQEELALHWLHCQAAFVPVLGFLVSQDGAVAAMEKLMSRFELEERSQLSKVACLRAQLLEKAAWARARGDELRCLVFVQQRIAAHVLSAWIGADTALRNAGIRASYIAARDATITPRLRVTPGQANDCVARFREGKLNVIVATAVLEEGFDVPEANVVITFDAIKDSVELAQRFGRARRAERRVVAMDERHDRPLQRLENVRREQDALIEKFEPRASPRNPAAELEAQQSRERGAVDVLQQDANPVLVLNLYVRKTKAVSEESCRKDGASFVYMWTYQTSLRDIQAEGAATSKKAARTQCAANLLAQLRSAVNDA